MARPPEVLARKESHMSHCDCGTCLARAANGRSDFTADQAIAELERLISEHAQMVQALKRMLDETAKAGTPRYWDSVRHAQDVLEQVEGNQ